VAQRRHRDSGAVGGSHDPQQQVHPARRAASAGSRGEGSTVTRTYRPHCRARIPSRAARPVRENAILLDTSPARPHLLGVADVSTPSSFGAGRHVEPRGAVGGCLRCVLAWRSCFGRGAAFATSRRGTTHTPRRRRRCVKAGGAGRRRARSARAEPWLSLHGCRADPCAVQGEAM